MMITMKQVRFAFVLVFVSNGLAFTQATAPAAEVTLCDLYKHPEEYLGKMIKVRGKVAGNDLWIDAFTQQPCSSSMSVIVVFPKDVRPTPDFDLVPDASFRQLDDALHGRRPIHIEATFEGRFDSVVVVRGGKRIRVGEGYGKKRDYDGRIVLHQVSDVTAKPLPHK